MTPKAGRYAAGAATGLAIALSLTACKGAGHDKASGDGQPAGGGVQLTAAQTALAKVSTETGALKSFRGTMSMTAGASGQNTQMKGTMAVSMKPSMAMKFTVPALKVNGQSTQGFTEVLVGDKIYMKMPALKAQTGKPWMSLSLSQLSKSSGVDLNSMNQGSQGDPSTNAKMLTASKDVHQVGQETVAGVRTTHYEGTFSLKDALAKLDSQQRTQAQKSFGEAGVDKMDFNMWVDGQQLPRRMSIATPAGSKLGMKMTMNYTAFNVPVSVTAPPKSQVKDGSDLLGGGGQNMPS